MNEQCFSLATKEHKPNFSETNKAPWLLGMQGPSTSERELWLQNSSNSMALWRRGVEWRTAPIPLCPCGCYRATTRSDITGTSRCCFRPGRILYFCSPCEAPPPHAKTPKDSQLMSSCAHGLQIPFLNFRSAPFFKF